MEETVGQGGQREDQSKRCLSVDASMTSHCKLMGIRTHNHYVETRRTALHCAHNYTFKGSLTLTNC